MFRRVIITVLCAASLLLAACSHHNKKVQNPIANINSQQPDKVLYDRAMDAMKHNKYDVARLSLQTLINTYPDSEYVARAKLAIGDSWYAEGGTAALTQAESEYKDFITFFPNMPEAAEAQMKVANIHYKMMEKADRDPTQAFRAQDEYRQLIQQFPDSPLVPQAKQRLLEVQEVLAEREYMIGHFYYLKESYPAAVARLKSLTDTYPLYSGADQALYELGQCYEREMDIVRRSRVPETAKGVLLKQYTEDATAAYDRILTRYPLEDRAEDAKKRLQALKQPIPQATPAAIAEDKAEIAGRGTQGHFGKVMENFHHGPDVYQATKVGEPTMVDPKQASAPDLIRQANDSVKSSLSGGGTKEVAAETINTSGAAPGPNAPVPRSDAAATTSPNAATSGEDNGAKNNAGSEMKNDLAPGTNPAPPLPPSQVNDAASANTPSDSTSQAAASNQQQAAPADTSKESTSKKKKKHKWLP